MKIQLKRSNVLQSGAAKQPTAAQTEYGELCVNYSTEDPSLFIRDSADNIIKVGTDINNLVTESDGSYLSKVNNDTAAGEITFEQETYFEKNVGIGTSDPQSKLEVAGDVNISAAGGRFIGPTAALGSSASAPTYSFSGQQTGMFLAASNNLAFSTDGSEKVRLNASGHLGIGTDSPSAKLTISEPINSSTPATMKFVNEGDRSITVGFKDHNASPKFAVSNGTQTTDFVVINAGGNVGIGTDSPISKLTSSETNAGGEGGAICIQNRGSGANTSVALHLTPNNGGGNDLERAASIKSRQELAGNYADLEFITSNSDTPAERMRISSNGNVGIGTDNPDAKLKINMGNSDNPATAFAVRQNNTADTAQATFSIESSPNDGVSRLISSATSTPQLAFYTGGAEQMRIDSNGDVGIGTDSPSQKLDVDGHARIATGTAGLGFIQFGKDTNQFDNYHIGCNGVGEFEILNKNIGSGVSMMKINSDGDMSVTGHANIGKPSDFWSNSGFFNVADHGNLTTQGSFATHLTSNGYRGANAKWVSLGTNSNTGAAQIELNPAGYISFNTESDKATGDSAGVSRRMTLTNDGKLGIGITSPTQLLHVSGNGLFTGTVTATTFSGNATTATSAENASKLDNLDSSQFIRSDANDVKTSGYTRYNDNIHQYWGNGNDFDMWCNGSHMYMDLQSGIGNLYIRDGGDTRFTFNDAGTFTATANITAYSDISLKENIETIPNALDKVLALRGVGYNRIDLEEKPRQIGVIAQEVEEVIPEVVLTDEEGIKSVAYGNLVGLLIESVKELKAEVNELKAKLEG